MKHVKKFEELNEGKKSDKTIVDEKDVTIILKTDGSLKILGKQHAGTFHITTLSKDVVKKLCEKLK